LSAGGWGGVRGQELGRHEHSSLESGWQDFPPEAEGGPMQLWSARWRDKEQNEVAYTLVYWSPLGAQGLRPTHVHVSGWYSSRERAARVRQDVEAQIEQWMGVVRPRVPKESPSPCPR
jgi:hypothetical protein